MPHSARLALLATCIAAVPAAAQEVGQPAPDITLQAATAAGVGEALRLSDLRGRTVVLAFFYKARTPG